MVRNGVTNIKEAFLNLSHYICLIMQYMNNNVGSALWTKLMKCKGLGPLNNTMLLAYQIFL